VITNHVTTTPNILYISPASPPSPIQPRLAIRYVPPYAAPAVETVLSLGVDLVVLILDSLPSLCRLVLSLLSNLPLSSVYV